MTGLSPPSPKFRERLITDIDDMNNPDGWSGCWYPLNNISNLPVGLFNNDLVAIYQHTATVAGGYKVRTQTIFVSARSSYAFDRCFQRICSYNPVSGWINGQWNGNSMGMSSLTLVDFYLSGSAHCWYRKNYGNVEIHAQILADGTGNRVGTLPSYFRPGDYIFFPAVLRPAATPLIPELREIQIDPSGDVGLSGATPAADDVLVFQATFWA